ncbi:MAG: TrkA family potassium uptake protein [Chloroflexi bacterium]|nr:TrkA family potassium uptake protein [Chloroflexota bacterium]
MKIVILGCGRVGSNLARRLDREGHQVTILDVNSEQFRRLGSEFRGNALVGNGIDEDVLRRAGLHDADAFAAVTNGDNTNIMTAQIAQLIFKVPKVVARIYDPLREESYRGLGIDTFCPTTTGAVIMRGLVLSQPTGFAFPVDQSSAGVS